MANALIEGKKEKEEWGWRRHHRIGLGILLTILLGVLVIGYVRRPYRLDEGLVKVGGEVVELEKLLDPNVEDWASLARVPHVSEKLAKAIVAYREENRERFGRGVVYQNIEDLGMVRVDKVKVNKKTLEMLRPFLKFPGDATRPAPAPRGLIGPKPVMGGGGDEGEGNDQ